MQPLAAQFKTYLAKQRLARATLKNYVSDTDRFLDWLAGELQEVAIEPVQLTAAAFQNYLRWLNDPTNRIPPATARRYLSSLRRFGKWLAQSGLADADPAAALTAAVIDPTVEQLSRDFKNALTKQKLAPSTVKNYVSDVYNYLLWAKANIKITGSNSEILSL